MNQPLAYVHPGAKIAKNVVVEPFTTIHNNVIIGEGTWIGSNVTIMEGARIGKNCNIFRKPIFSNPVCKIMNSLLNMSYRFKIRKQCHPR